MQLYARHVHKGFVGDGKIYFPSLVFVSGEKPELIGLKKKRSCDHARLNLILKDLDKGSLN